MKCFSVFFSGLIISFLSFFSVFAKEVSPKVLVYGDNLEAFAAAMQSARSNVPTIWVLPTKTFCESCFTTVTVDTTKNSLMGGMWSSVLREMSFIHQNKDSLIDFSSIQLDRRSILDAIQSLMEKERNLSILYEQNVKKVVNNSKTVEIELSNKKKFKLNAAVDLSSDLALLLTSGVNKDKLLLISEERFADLSNNMLRTLVAIGDNRDNLYGFTVKNVLDNSEGNIFFSVVNQVHESGNHDAIFQLNKGQAIGASAAYCAFFKTTSDKIDLRKLQTELLSFGCRILPFVDIKGDDPNFNALQKFFLTEILPWDKRSEPFYFNRSDSVSVASVKLVLQQLYSRAQLWFVDNKSTFFTVKDVVELVKVISYRSDELDEEVKKAWKKRFKFDRDFQAENIVNRYEFAVLLDAYADPFAKSISLDGVILR